MEECFDSPDLSTFAERLAELLEQVTLDFERDRLAAKHSLSIACSLARQQAPSKALPIEQGRQTGGLTGPQIKRIKAFVDEHLEAPIQITEMRDLTQLSTGHFYRAFKQTFNQTPHRYLMARRVEKAREMMFATDESLANISLACGFTDQAHLSKLFKSKFHTSPSAWRRDVTNQEELGHLDAV